MNLGRSAPRSGPSVPRRGEEPLLGLQAWSWCWGGGAEIKSFIHSQGPSVHDGRTAALGTPFSAPGRSNETPTGSPLGLGPSLSCGFQDPLLCVAAYFAFGFVFKRLDHLKRRNPARKKGGERPPACPGGGNS